MVSSLTEFASKLRSEKVLPYLQTEGTLRELHDSLTDLMKQLANEPSVGLYFVQQHVHKAVPGMVALKAQMVDSIQEVEYVTQDVKDALNSVRSMKEVGPAVIEQMIKCLDSSLPRLAALRPSRRDGPALDSLIRTGECKDGLVMEHSEKHISSQRSPNFSPVEQSSKGPVLSSSSSVGAQAVFNLPLLNGVSSAQASLEKQSSGYPISAGDYSGYVSTTFDSAFQKASSMANVSKWNYYSKTTKLESTSTGNGRDSQFIVRSEGSTEDLPSIIAPSVLGTSDSRLTSPSETAPGSSVGASTSKGNSSVARDRQEMPNFLVIPLNRPPSFPAFREVSDYSKPGQYVRAALGSARQTAESVSQEATKFLCADGKRQVSSLDKTVEGWGWLQVPSKALRVFVKHSQNSEGLTGQEASIDRIIIDEASSSKTSEEKIQRLLEEETASYEALAVEKAAKFEEWLQDTKEEDQKVEVLA